MAMALQATGIAGVKAPVPFFVARELVAGGTGVAGVVVALLMAAAAWLLVVTTADLEPSRVVTAFPGVQRMTGLAIGPSRQVHSHGRADEISLVAVVAGARPGSTLVGEVVGVAVNALHGRVRSPEGKGGERVVKAGR